HFANLNVTEGRSVINTSPALVSSPPRLSPGPLGRWYAIEALASAGGSVLTVGIFFYMKQRFGWGLRQNFQLAAVQGAVDTAGALRAGAVAARLPHRHAIALLNAAMSLATLAAAVTSGA